MKSEEDLLVEGFSGSKHERLLLQQQLMPFFLEGWIERVLFTVKRGKEAAVYCCKSQQGQGCEYIAAKVYHPRAMRAMRNYGAYTEGRHMFSTDGSTHLKERDKRAIRKKSQFGRNLGDVSWTTHEFSTLLRLEEIGVPCPRALDRSGSVILMEYLGDEYRGAPTLIEVGLEPMEAERLLEEALQAIELMLEDYIVHGDLSAYNILLWDGTPFIIDLPQVIDPMANPNARKIFQRDVQRVCQYFEQQGAVIDWREVEHELWSKYIDQP